MKSEFKKLENVGAKCCVKIEPKTKFALKSFSENKQKLKSRIRSGNWQSLCAQVSMKTLC